MSVHRPVRVLSSADIDALADWAEITEAISHAYAAPLTAEMVPPRTVARRDGFWLRGLAAVSPSGRNAGAKLIAYSAEARSASYLIALFDWRDASLTALLDGDRVTGLRTAATSVVAASALHRIAAPRVAVIGSGFEAWNHVSALSAAGPVESLQVYSPRESSRRAFADRATSVLGLAAHPTNTPDAAVSGASLVICAARSRDETPTLHGEWLAPGTTVISIGSTLPEQREVDTETLRRAALVVADMPDEVVADTGDFLAARGAGVHPAGGVISLSDVLSHRHPARRSDEEILVYKSVGSALQDVVVAELLAAKAEACETGHVIPSPCVAVSK